MKRSTLLLLICVLLGTARAEAFPTPPTINKGPFPPFDQGGSWKKFDSIANNDWITLSIRTKFSPTSAPDTRRYMLHKESIRLKDGWFIVSTLNNHPKFFIPATHNTGEPHWPYGFQGETQRGIRVNCKDEIIQTPSTKMPWGDVLPPLNYYRHSSGWFLTKREIKSGKLVDLPGNSNEVRQIDKASLFNYLCDNNSVF